MRIMYNTIKIWNDSKKRDKFQSKLCCQLREKKWNEMIDFTNYKYMLIDNTINLCNDGFKRMKDIYNDIFQIEL